MLQSLPLSVKVEKTKQRICEWVDHYGEDGVYISFSGGKDSTVLLNITRKMFPQIKAVFFDTGLEYPEIRDFVKTFDNVDILKPKMTFKQVIEKYGYPFISKEVSECVYGARKYLTALLNENKILTNERTNERTNEHHRTHIFTESLLEQANTQSILKMSRGGTITNIANSEEFANMLNDRMKNRKGGCNQRLANLLGMLTKDQTIKTKENMPEKDRSQFAQTKWQFFLEAPFEISNNCCRVMKKGPSHRYIKETGRIPITAQMASESRLRLQQWIRNGCNGFNMKSPISNPMSFWTEQDVLLYIKLNNIKICSVYGDIVNNDGSPFIPDENIQYDMLSLFDDGRPLLKTTGCNRTGCVFCGYGCHLEKPGEGRFERLKETHPKLYEYIMKPTEEHGLNYKFIIDWINEHGNLNIHY